MGDRPGASRLVGSEGRARCFIGFETDDSANACCSCDYRTATGYFGQERSVDRGALIVDNLVVSVFG